MLKLSADERILIHLEDHIDEQFEIVAKRLQPSLIFSQSGIEEALNISHRIVSERLRKLKKDDLIEEKRVYLRETGRFRNFYFLTSNGIIKAKELKERVGKTKINVKAREETKEMKISELIEHLKKIVKEPVETGYSYIVKGERHDKAYEIFKSLLERGYEGIVISNISPKNIEKEYNIKVEIYWLSEISGKGIFHPSRLDFEVAKTITDFLNSSKKPLILLEGFEYLVQVNGFDVCSRWLKTVNDLIANRGAIFILPINPELFDKKEFMLVAQNMRIYEPREIVPVEISYANVLRYISPPNTFDLQSFLTPKRYIDFSERKPEIKYFFGRDEELKKILNFINSKANILIVKGIAGIGKTALISKALERYKIEMNVFWHRFYSFSTLRTMLTKLSDFFAKIGMERLRNYIAGGKIDVEEIGLILEEELSNIRALLVFDNFERASNEIVDFFSSLKELKTNSKIIVSGRSIAPFYDRRDVAIRKTVVELKLEGLDRASSEKLLKCRGIEKDIDRFYNLTKGHPLMLELISP
ncbi:MAG: DUF835 domain-containing protein, partial [Candidatus Thermoplasmatota archaeon]